MDSGIDVLEKFKRLDKALIDASSIIYIQKAGFFSELAGYLKLYSLREIIRETGFSDLKIHLVKSGPDSFSNDEKLVACAKSRRIVVISEDRKILKQMERENIPYFNAIMMLHFLLFKKKIGPEAHFVYQSRLRRIARYNASVLRFAEEVYEAVHSS